MYNMHINQGVIPSIEEGLSVRPNGRELLARLEAGAKYERELEGVALQAVVRCESLVSCFTDFTCPETTGQRAGCMRPRLLR